MTKHSNHEHHQNHSGHDHSRHNHEGHNHSGHDHSGHDHSGHDHAGHDHGDHAKLYKKKFFNSLIIGLPILFLAPMMGITLPFQFSFKYSEYVVAILATILFFYGGEPFLSGAKDELKAKQPAMMMLVSMGIIVAYVYSLYGFIMNHVLFRNIEIMDFFFELSSLILIMLLGHWLEMKSIATAQNALQAIAALLPNEVTRIKKDGSQETVRLEDVVKDDILLVKAGESVPADGFILSGESTVNESMLTGESQDIIKKVGDTVIGGSQNNFGSIQIQVLKSSDEGYLSQVMNLVSEASKEKSKSEAMADIVAKYLFYFALVVGIITLVAWTFIDNLDTGIMQMVTVLVIACPHALGLAIPLVTARSTAIGANNGLLVKSRMALEKTPKVDVVLMDKTGTLTEGNFEVQAYASTSDSCTDLEMLQLFASLESHSNHPLSQGVMRKADALSLDILEVSDVTTIAGIGLQGAFDDKNIKITSVKYLQSNNIEYNQNIFHELTSKSYSISYLLIDEVNVGYVALGDTIKEESYALVKALKAQNIQAIMLTGDNKNAAESIAKDLGIETVYAEMMPEDKEAVVRKYKDEGHFVMMVGDGINDAPSLARADVAVAIGAGTDIANETADIILVKSNPYDIVHILNLGRKTTRKMKENLFWGAGYNFIAIPVAAGILSSFGITLTPAMGAVLMSLSTTIVAINAILLKID